MGARQSYPPYGPYGYGAYGPPQQDPWAYGTRNVGSGSGSAFRPNYPQVANNSGSGSRVRSSSKGNSPHLFVPRFAHSFLEPDLFFSQSLPVRSWNLPQKSQALLVLPTLVSIVWCCPYGPSAYVPPASYMPPSYNAPGQCLST